jgi:hypothetical protein
MGGISAPAEAGAHHSSGRCKIPINRFYLQLAIAFAIGSIRYEPGGEFVRFSLGYLSLKEA